jgi:hypothetical protein
MLETFEVNEKVIIRTTNRLYNRQAISGIVVEITKSGNYIIQGFFNSSVNLQSLINNGEDGVKVLEDVYLIIENYKNKQKKY